MDKEWLLFECGELLDTDIQTALFGSITEVGIGYMCNQRATISSNGKSYLKPVESSYLEGKIFRLTGEQIWKADQWKNVPLLERAEGKAIWSGVEYDVYYYTSFAEENMGSYTNNQQNLDINMDSVERFLSLTDSNKLGYSDIHLMVPCCLKNYTRNMGKEQGGIAQNYIESITANNKTEFSDEFVKMLQREIWGVFQVYTHMDNDYHKQNCLITLAEHETTNLGILNIIIPAVAVPGHCILNDFCATTLLVNGSDGLQTIKDWLIKYGIEIYGSPRSVVFVSSAISEESIVNALVAENLPMGKIKGIEFVSKLEKDLAQYDTANVYASEVCLIEINKCFEENISRRIFCQTIEIFFIELIMLQDAAISRISSRIKKEIMEEYKNPRRMNSTNNLEELICETSQAVLFFDFGQFLFPTVRHSAENVAKCFGMERLMSTYYQNKEILEQLIGIHSAQVVEAENKIINALLLILAMIQVIPIFTEIIEKSITGELSSINLAARVGSVGVCIMLWLIFKITRNRLVTGNYIKGSLNQNKGR